MIKKWRREMKKLKRRRILVLAFGFLMIFSMLSSNMNAFAKENEEVNAPPMNRTEEQKTQDINFELTLSAGN